jgi:hypothetical protein
MDSLAPATITPSDVRDLMAASTRCEAALSIVKGTDVVCVGPFRLVEDNSAVRVVLRSSGVRELLASVTKHVERLYRTEHALTWEGLTLAAALVNRNITAVLDDGTAVQIIE